MSRLVWLFRVLLFAVLMTSCKEPRPLYHEPAKKVILKSSIAPNDQNQSWTLAIGGDTVLSRRVEKKTLESRSMTFAFGDMVPFMRKMDLFFVNLECQIADVGAWSYKNREHEGFFFRAKPKMVKSLVESGVDVVTIANNHGMDFGPKALLQTIKLCRDNKIAIVGGGRDAREAHAPGYVRAGNQVLAFLGLNSTNTLMNAGVDTPGLAAAQYQHPGHFLATAESALRSTKDVANMAVFTVHWGPNYRSKPTEEQRGLAREVLDLGYGAFIAHSAHQFLGVEIHQGKPIIHDAGNFVCDFTPKDEYWNEKNLIFVLHYRGTQLEWMEALPIFREDAVTNFARGEIAESICKRFTAMSEELGTTVECTEDHRAVIRVVAPD